MITPAPRNTGHGPHARCTCDVCGETVDVRCDLEQTQGHKLFANEGQARAKLTKLGWSYIKKTLRCERCETERKTMQNKPAPAPAGAALREPSMTQRRAIFDMLEAVYDREAGCFTGRETDKSVADAIGDGVLPGWVAQVREQFFGPSGANMEIDDVLARLDALGNKVLTLFAEAGDAQGKIDGALATLANLQKDGRAVLSQVDEEKKRIAAIRKAVGPRAGG